MRPLHGWKRDKPDPRDWMMAAPHPRTVLPAHAYIGAFDHIPVFDQLQIGSCAANAGASMFAHLNLLDGGTAMTFSRLYLYARVREVEGVPLSEDSGAFIRDVMRALAKFGVCDELTWEYSDGLSRFAIEPDAMATAEALKHQALYYYRCPSLRTIKASIAEGFPVEFGFDVPKDIFDGRAQVTGEVLLPSDPTAFEGGHANLLIGYDDTAKVGAHVGAFRSRNSWGPSFGLGGDLLIPYAFFETGHASDAWSLRKVEV